MTNVVFAQNKDCFFVVEKGIIIAVTENNAEIRQMANELATQIARHSGIDTRVFVGHFKTKTGINFVSVKNERLGAKGFILEVNQQKIVISAQTPTGFANGVEALMKLMPKEIFNESPTRIQKIAVPCR